MPTLVQCPRCTKNWVPEDSGKVCMECEEPMAVDLAVVNLHRAVAEVDSKNFNLLTAQHIIAIKKAHMQLEAIINVLERYSKQN